MAVTLLPLVFALMHATGVLHLPVLQRLDDIIYDARLRATAPGTEDSRVVIVDIDERSLAEVGRWPWGRHRLASLVDELFERQHIAALGFDVVFAEPDDSSGLSRLTELARNEFKDNTAFQDRLRQLQPSLDHDALFARALQGRPVVLGYYLTSDRDGRKSGVLPAAVFDKSALQGRVSRSTVWNGYGANIEGLAKAAMLSGHFNPISDGDGVIRSLPLVGELEGRYYESLSLSLFRLLTGMPSVAPGIANDKLLSKQMQSVDRIVLKQGSSVMNIPVDDRLTTLIPYRGKGGPQGGSFRYISAVDVLTSKLPPDSLKGKVIIVGTTAPGLWDQRATPVGEAYPGVEAHANMLTGLMDGRLAVRPDYAMGYEVVLLLIAGIGLAVCLPLLSAVRAVALSAAALVLLAALNFYLYMAQGLVLPVAGSLVMAVTAFALNMSYGYFVESRSKRELAQLFGTYVPPELVDEMVKDPDSYSMQAANRELTVMFCDMRGFTKMSETMEPLQLQQLLNEVFSRLTGIIRGNRGTIDKYMGDCVMAFWGAPVEISAHASLAVKSALEMANAVRDINAEHRTKGLPEIGVGIGLNTGSMCVGDMGSNIRRAYTVVGDAVNLGSRLEGLSKAYGVDIVVSESTRKLASEYAWQELDRVRVKGKDIAVAIFWPVGPADRIPSETAAELKSWGQLLKAYRAQDWDQADVVLLNLTRANPKKYLYQLYSERIATMRNLPFDPSWDGATNFETK
ncbi:adenylate/guanylate cyclase domain-containing protein [Curvibacter sp. APW13]|uniref:CHASE2 domain-containing protein n=1 Tax=Curvibacter sp. APW13 TaxID=3077236 RepID=UPI0028DEC65C|nr:adenylate/guanylate cyclase domain-containing protein [Curvibacter sp. APW13]MDT8990144.1 adenylate/guanylate cyclase domain-containing protein [Curvibacter sp. APW13]